MNMESNVVFILRCILAATIVAVHNFIFRNLVGTVCQSKKYIYPWLSPVNLDSYIEKRHYIQEFILKKLYLFDNNQESLASIMEEAQSSLPNYRGLVLLVNEWTKTFWEQAYHIPDKMKFIIIVLFTILTVLMTIIAENNKKMERVFQLDPLLGTLYETIYNKEKDINPPDDIVELQTYISKTLFEHHSNLNIINSGNLQPSDTGQKPSITLYCDGKGLIPRNEAKFPKVLEINDTLIQIFIKEGDFKLCPGFRTTKSEWNNPLRMGACIGVQGIMSSATMGPFIDLPDGSLGFLTCAHLFHNVPVGAIIMQPSQLAFAGFDIMESDKVCGVLVHKVFEPQRIVSVDVAVVKITSRIPNRGMFAIGSNEEILKAGFDAPPVFDSGSIKEHISPTDANRPIVKFGSETGLTKGAFTLNGSHVKISDQIGFESPCGNQTLTMHNQYEIQQIGNIPFFRPGDSGSGVFILDDHKELYCVGMAIGCTSYGSAIVTPVGAIFEALGLPKKLKTFYHESMEE